MSVTDTPKISIILPVLNEADVISDTLAALQAARGRDHELIVVDGGSQDETVRIAQPLADVLLHAPRGRARQMQAGAEAARGDILWFLHADTGVPADGDRQLLHALQERNLDWGRFNVRFSSGGWRMRLVAAGMNLRSRLTGIATGDQGIFVRRSRFRHVSGYPDIPLMEDIALSRALREHGRPACLRSTLRTSPRRWQSHGYLRTVVLMWSLRLGYWLGVSPHTLAKYYGAEPR
jgi:rSAM/selenodomain-associated transferase 2